MDFGHPFQKHSDGGRQDPKMANKELVNAAHTGNIEVLHKMLRENPLMLAEATLSSPEPILHVATKARQLNFVRELIKHDPDAPKELSNDGFRAMDVASGIGDVEIVKELLKVGASNCRLKGKDGRTAIHYAAAKGRVEVIHQLLESCPDSINDATAFGETALHLTVKSHQFDAFRELVQWAETLGGFKTIVNWPDHDGNTVLHLAASRKQVETIKLLLDKSNAIRGTLEVNATNSKGLTPMDVLDMVMESPNDVALREILQRFGAVDTQNVRAVTPSPTSSRQRIAESVSTQPPSDPSKNWFEYFKFKPSRDSPSDARNVLLIVAALIATITFQAGVNPPSSILETNTKSAADTTSGNQPPLAPPSPPMFNPTLTSGVAAIFEITGSGATPTPYLFLFANTLGFTASLSIIIYLTGGFPFQRELLIAIYAMMFTYGFSVSSITDKEVVTYVILGIASVLPFSLRWLPWWGTKAWNYWRRRHRANSGLSGDQKTF